MGTIHQSAERFGGGGRRRGRFHSRTGGYALARHVWICKTCRTWHEAEAPDPETAPRKPGACANGHGGPDWAWHCDSAREAQHFVLLLGLASRASPSVRNLIHHPAYPLLVWTPGERWEKVAKYEADVAYDIRVEGDWQSRIDDVKPKDPRAQDPVFRLKRRWFEAQTGRAITIVW